MYRTFLSLALLVALAGSAKSASVGFLGTGFNSESVFGGATAGTGFLGAGFATANFFTGDAPNGVFSDRFDFAEGGSIGALLNAPEFTLGGQTVFAQNAGSQAQVIDNGTTDTLQFTIQFSTVAPGGVNDGTITVTFVGDLISGGSVVSKENFNEIIGNNPPSSGTSGSVLYTDLTNGFRQYSGSALAVPEPGSFMCLAALGCVGLLRRNRS